MRRVWKMAKTVVAATAGVPGKLPVTTTRAAPTLRVEVVMAREMRCWGLGGGNEPAADKAADDEQEHARVGGVGNVGKGAAVGGEDEYEDGEVEQEADFAEGRGDFESRGGPAVADEHSGAEGEELGEHEGDDHLGTVGFEGGVAGYEG